MAHSKERINHGHLFPSLPPPAAPKRASEEEHGEGQKKPRMEVSSSLSTSLAYMRLSTLFYCRVKTCWLIRYVTCESERLTIVMCV